VKGPGIGESVFVVGPSGATLPARVRDSEPSTLLLGMNAGGHEGDPVELLAGSDVSVEFTNRRGVCRIQGTARAAGEGLALRVDATGVVELIQRRDFVRIDAVVPVTYQPLGPEGWTVTAHTREVSGGGFRIAQAEALRLGDMMRFTLELGEGADALSAVATAVREAGPGEFGMRFVEILERERQRLVHWVFERERILRQMARQS
jgi:c-di-GMP-binding flagellar brake protein YcgR